MATQRSLTTLTSCLLLFASGCGREVSVAPPFVPLAENLAADTRFTFDEVEVPEKGTLAEAESQHDFAASTRLLDPDRFKDGVLCQLLILGVNLDGVVVNCGYTTAFVKPDGEGRVSIEGKLRIPRRPGEYEIRLEIFEDEETNVPVGRVPLFVTPGGVALSRISFRSRATGSASADPPTA